MANLEQQFEWLKEVLAEKPQRFADFYKDNIANYLDIELIESTELKDFFNDKFENFNQCKNINDVRKFVDNITGYIVMKAQIEEIIADYFS